MIWAPWGLRGRQAAQAARLLSGAIRAAVKRRVLCRTARPSGGAVHVLHVIKRRGIHILAA